MTNTLILSVEPFVGAMPQDIRAFAEHGLREQQLAQSFAIVSIMREALCAICMIHEINGYRMRFINGRTWNRFCLK